MVPDLISRKQIKIFVIILGLFTLAPVSVYGFNQISKSLKPIFETAQHTQEPQSKLKKQASWNMRLFLLSHNINSVEDYVSWLQKNIVYKSDNTRDDWADPHMTIQNGFGDCEDIAFLSASVLTELGLESKVLAFGHGKEAHVICLFQKDGRYYIFDNTKFYRDIKSPSLKEIFAFLATKHNARYLLELSLDTKSYKPIFVFKSELKS